VLLRRVHLREARHNEGSKEEGRSNGGRESSRGVLVPGLQQEGLDHLDQGQDEDPGREEHPKHGRGGAERGEEHDPANRLPLHLKHKQERLPHQPGRPDRRELHLESHFR